MCTQKTISNDKNNSANVVYMDRDAKVSTVTSSYDLPLRGQRSKKVKIWNYIKWQKKNRMTCWARRDMQNCPRWPYGRGLIVCYKGVKGHVKSHYVKPLAKCTCSRVSTMSTSFLLCSRPRIFEFSRSMTWFALHDLRSRILFVLVLTQNQSLSAKTTKKSKGLLLKPELNVHEPGHTERQ